MPIGYSVFRAIDVVLRNIIAGIVCGPSLLTNSTSGRATSRGLPILSGSVSTGSLRTCATQESNCAILPVSVSSTA